MLCEAKVARPPMLLGFFFHLAGCDVFNLYHWLKEYSKLKSKPNCFWPFFFVFNPALYYTFVIHHKTHFKPSSILPENSCVLRRMVDHGNDGVVAPNVEVPSLLEKGHVVPLLCHPEGNVRAWNSICNGQVARFQHNYPFIFITPASSMSSIANWHTHVLKLQLLWQTHRFEFISSCICTNELLEVWNRLMIDNCDSYWLRI